MTSPMTNHVAFNVRLVTVRTALCAWPTRYAAAGFGVVPAIIAGMPGLSRDDVAHVAHLARLGLTDEELGRLEGQLNHILDQYAILAQLDTDDIPPTAQTIELENILRDDVVRPSLPVEAVLANAAEREGDFIRVPPILGGD
jgi:aspartyl-tRNA(Asn)/glutamyl-tRNA(Gln) amidotransferase subunit C